MHRSAVLRPRALLLLVLLWLPLASTLSAQITVPFSCSFSSSAPTTIDVANTSGLAADLLFTCTGGTPGTIVTADLSVSFNAIVANTVVNGVTDARLLINGPSTPILGTNAFPGIANGSQMLFPQVPIPNPGSSSSTTLRLTAVRLDARQLGSLSQVFAYAAVSGVPLANPSALVAFTTGCSYRITGAVNRLLASANSAGMSVTVPSGFSCPWTASTGAAWLRFSPAPPAGGFTSSQSFLLTADANTGPSRTTTYTVAGSTFSLTQEGTALTLSSVPALYNAYSAFDVPASTTPETRTLILNSTTPNAPFTATVGGVDVVTVSPSSGTTPATITLRVDPSYFASTHAWGSTNTTITFSSLGDSVTYSVSLWVDAPGPGPAKAATYDRGSSTASLALMDRNADGSCCAGDLVGYFGAPGDLPLAGDWTGDGTKKTGVFRRATGLWLLDLNHNNTFDAGDKALTFAPQAGDVPVVGDWTGTGVDRAGIFRAGIWYLDVTGDGSFTGRAYLGQSGDIPIIGNWNGVGTRSKVGIYRPAPVGGQPGNFFLVDSNGDGLYTSADQPLFFLGQQGDLPIVGNWGGGSITKVGIFRPAGSTAANPGLFILDQNGSYTWDGPATDKVLYFAPYLVDSSITIVQPGDIPITGDWAPSYSGRNTFNVQGRTRIGLYRPGTGTFFFDVSNDGTFQGRAYLGGATHVPIGSPVVSNEQIIGVNGMGSY